MKSDYWKDIRKKEIDSYHNLYFNYKNIEDIKEAGCPLEGLLEIVRDRTFENRVQELGVVEACRIEQQKKIDVMNANKLWKEQQKMKGIIICLNQKRLMN